MADDLKYFRLLGLLQEAREYVDQRHFHIGFMHEGELVPQKSSCKQCELLDRIDAAISGISSRST